MTSYERKFINISVIANPKNKSSELFKLLQEDYDTFYYSDDNSRPYCSIPGEIYKHESDRKILINKILEIINEEIFEISLKEEIVALDLFNILPTGKQRAILIDHINPRCILDSLTSPYGHKDLDYDPAKRAKRVKNRIQKKLKILEAYDADEFHILVSKGLKPKGVPLNKDQTDGRRDPAIKGALDFLAFHNTPEYRELIFPDAKLLNGSPEIDLSKVNHLIDEKNNVVEKKHFKQMEDKLIQAGLTIRNAKIIYDCCT